MISEMPEPICVRLSGIVGARWEIVFGQKNTQNFEIEIFFTLKSFFSVLVPEPFLISAGVTTLSALRTFALRHIYLIVNIV